MTLYHHLVSIHHSIWETAEEYGRFSGGVVYSDLVITMLAYMNVTLINAELKEFQPHERTYNIVSNYPYDL